MADDGVSYLMKLDDIALNFLGLSFPNKGKVGLFLFGNPSGEETSESSLGWYGGYKRNKHPFNFKTLYSWDGRYLTNYIRL